MQKQITNSVTPVEYVGGYRMGVKTKTDNNYVEFKFVRKPKAIHRFFVKLILGWIWVDEEYPYMVVGDSNLNRIQLND